jgi:hypothetical protein
MEKEYLEFFETPKILDELFKKFGIETGADILGKLIREGFIKQEGGGKFCLTDSGKNKLKELKKENHKSQEVQKETKKFGGIEVNSGGGDVNFVQGDDGIAIQKNIHKKSVPRKESSPLIELLSTIAEKIGVKLSLWILGILGFGGTGYFIYVLIQLFNSKTFNPYPSLNSFAGGFGPFFIIGFVALFFTHKYGRCHNPKCKKLNGYEEVGDGRILEESPGGNFKIERTYTCKKCGDTYTRTGWENLSNSATKRRFR